MVPEGASAAEAVVEVLARSGVDTVFGIPGVHNLALFDALSRRGIRTILGRHEGAAAHAADGFARATGRPGVVLTTTGPGVANTLGAAGEAWAASSPVLHLTTQVATDALARGVGARVLHQSPAQMDAFVPFVKRAVRVESAVEAAAIVDEMLTLVSIGRPGPGYVEIPVDLLEQPGGTPSPAGAVETPARPETDAVPALAELLADARAPVLWAGGGVVHAGAESSLAAVAERLGAPVVTTFMGRGASPDDHPLAVGLPPHEPEVAKLLASSDVLLAIGTDFDGGSTQNGRLRLPPRIAQIDIEAASIGRTYDAVPIIGDARIALNGLVEALDRMGERPADEIRARKEEVQELRSTAWRGLRADARTAPAVAFIDELKAALPEEAVVVADMCVAGYWCAGYLPVNRSRRILFPSWGTLGFALPAAIGAAIGAECPVAAVVGDAGFAYFIGELATAAELGIDLIVLVVNDRGYGMLRFDETQRYGRTFSTDLFVPDLGSLAAAFGMPHQQAELGGGLEGAVRQAVAAGGSHLIELPIALFPPRTTSPRWPTRGGDR